MQTSTSSKAFSSGRSLLVLATWAVALFGSLQIHLLKGLFGHAICGPWGCGPPVSALVGWHTFWCLLIFPALAILKRQLRSTTTRNLGIGLVLLSVTGIAALLLLDGLNNSAAEKYLWRWCGFRIATFVDFPLVQIGLAGLWLHWSTRNNPNQHVEVESDESKHV